MTTHKRFIAFKKLVRLERVRGWEWVPFFTGYWEKRMRTFPKKAMTRKEKKKLKMYFKDIVF